jgi:hypothetical protein
MSMLLASMVVIATSKKIKAKMMDFIALDFKLL